MIVPNPAIKIPKLATGELKVKVIGAGPNPNTLSPVIEGELTDLKKFELQKSVPLQETTISEYVIDVAVLEIGELKSCNVCVPAVAKYVVASVNIVIAALA
jgi:hypothetical protein